MRHSREAVADSVRFWHIASGRDGRFRFNPTVGGLWISFRGATTYLPIAIDPPIQEPTLAPTQPAMDSVPPITSAVGDCSPIVLGALSRL